MLHLTHEGGRIEIEACENALYTEIIIKDNGTGIAKEDMPHIFERFYKGKDSDDKSFGVGLALSRMIIAAEWLQTALEMPMAHGVVETKM